MVASVEHHERDKPCQVTTTVRGGTGYHLLLRGKQCLKAIALVIAGETGMRLLSPLLVGDCCEEVSYF